MKHTILYIIFVSLSFVGFGQKQKLPNNPNYEKRPFHLGFILGFNSLDYRLNNSETMMKAVDNISANDSVYGLEPASQLGFHIGIITDLRLGEYFNLRAQPGMILGQRNIDYRLRAPSSRHEYLFTTYSMQVPSIYIDMPILIKYKATRINNYRPYVIAGASVMYDLDSKRDNEDNEFYTIERNPLEFGVQVGVGIDCFMTFFKLGIELKGHFGFTDILVHESGNEFNSSIASLYTKMFMLSFNFE